MWEKLKRNTETIEFSGAHCTLHSPLSMGRRTRKAKHILVDLLFCDSIMIKIKTIVLRTEERKIINRTRSKTVMRTEGGNLFCFSTIRRTNEMTEKLSYRKRCASNFYSVFKMPEFLAWKRLRCRRNAFEAVALYCFLSQFSPNTDKFHAKYSMLVTKNCCYILPVQPQLINCKLIHSSAIIARWNESKWLVNRAIVNCFHSDFYLRENWTLKFVSAK